MATRQPEHHPGIVSAVAVTAARRAAGSPTAASMPIEPSACRGSSTRSRPDEPSRSVPKLPPPNAGAIAMHGTFGELSAVQRQRCDDGVRDPASIIWMKPSRVWSRRRGRRRWTTSKRRRNSRERFGRAPRRHRSETRAESRILERTWRMPHGCRDAQRILTDDAVARMGRVPPRTARCPDGRHDRVAATVGCGGVAAFDRVKTRSACRRIVDAPLSRAAGIGTEFGNWDLPVRANAPAESPAQSSAPAESIASDDRARPAAPAMSAPAPAGQSPRWAPAPTESRVSDTSRETWSPSPPAAAVPPPGDAAPPPPPQPSAPAVPPLFVAVHPSQATPGSGDAPVTREAVSAKVSLAGAFSALLSRGADAAGVSRAGVDGTCDFRGGD